MTMRVRSRRRGNHRIVLDPLDKGALGGGDPANERLRDLYLAGREQLIAEAGLGRVPIGFLEYEPDLPDELRLIPSRPGAYHLPPGQAAVTRLPRGPREGGR
jgi:hypothetical protein